MSDTITVTREDWETLKSQFQLIASITDDADAFCNAGLEFMAEVEHPDEVEPEPPVPLNHKGRHATCKKGGYWMLSPIDNFDDYVICNTCGETCPF